MDKISSKPFLLQMRNFLNVSDELGNKIVIRCHNQVIKDINEMAMICTEGPEYKSRVQNYIFLIKKTLEHPGHELLDKLKGEDSNKIIKDLLNPNPLPILHLAPSILAKEYNIIELQKNEQIQLKVSYLYSCKKCHKSEIATKEVCMRSADEAPVLVLHCINCGYQWNQ